MLFGHYPCRRPDSINLSRLLYNSLVASLQMRKCWWHFNYFNMASGVSALLCLAVCLFTLFAYTGAIPQITWCKHSFLFRSRHLSHPTRNSSEPRRLNIGCINLTTDPRSGFLIGTCAFSQVTISLL